MHYQVSVISTALKSVLPVFYSKGKTVIKIHILKHLNMITMRKICGVSLYLENIYLSIESLMEVILKWFRNVHNWGILVMSIRSSVN